MLAVPSIRTHSFSRRDGGGGIVKLNTIFGKAIPLQSWTGPDGSRRLRLPDFETIGT